MKKKGSANSYAPITEALGCSSTDMQSTHPMRPDGAHHEERLQRVAKGRRGLQSGSDVPQPYNKARHVAASGCQPTRSQ
ncbi:hypothetical protein DHEL01_v202668 [Diaporthe helianthi]|uniref:Uncharacterized protein n=1 Tax=Diaporthe helianthi TaxID=158607 RepID=A0A2P5I8V1_DIAHE|nr:hypothetical protein DHEL01_v202668 [Diaporthe helianthi]